MHQVHGGNIYEVAASLGCAPEDLLDFSASINPLGPPAGLIDEVNRHFHRLIHYPDIHNRALTRALASFHGLDPDRVVIGNGSTELIYRLPEVLRISRVLVVLPTFSEYPKAFELHGLAIDRLLCGPNHGFQPSVRDLEQAALRSRPQAILVTHPGSPSGVLLEAPVRRWLLDFCHRSGAFLVIDEVFADFCEQESFKGQLLAAERLVLIRSMTKFYGIPGLRLGYVLCAPALAADLRRRLPPWSVNTLAQLAGVFCLRQQAYRTETLELIERERNRMRREMSAMAGLKVFDGQANYLLARLAPDGPTAAQIRDRLLAGHRLLIRDCSSFAGLDKHDFRVAVKRPEENDRLLDALSRLLN